MGGPASRRPSGAATAYRLPHAAHKPGWPLCPAKRYSTTITDGGDTIEPFLSGLSEKGIDLAPLVVLQQAVTKLPIFCTPKGPGQYGWAGVDGIHFLLLSVALGMVFAVSPMNPRPTMCIRWRTGFSGLLRLLWPAATAALGRPGSGIFPSLRRSWQTIPPTKSRTWYWSRFEQTGLFSHGGPMALSPPTANQL